MHSVCGVKSRFTNSDFSYSTMSTLPRVVPFRRKPKEKAMMRRNPLIKFDIDRFRVEIVTFIRPSVSRRRAASLKDSMDALSKLFLGRHMFEDIIWSSSDKDRHAGLDKSEIKILRERMNELLSQEELRPIFYDLDKRRLLKSFFDCFCILLDVPRGYEQAWGLD